MAIAQKLTQDLQRRLFGISVEELRDLVAGARNDLADLKVEFNRLQTEVAKLREEVERARAQRQDAALEDLPLDQVLALHPGCHDALERFEIHGGGHRTLRQAASEANAELDTIVATIKNLLKDKTAA